MKTKILAIFTLITLNISCGSISKSNSGGGTLNGGETCADFPVLESPKVQDGTYTDDTRKVSVTIAGDTAKITFGQTFQIGKNLFAKPAQHTFKITRSISN